MRTPNKSRSRNKNNRRNNNSGGNVLNRVYDSAGPDGRVRGTPAQVIDKYQALAHDHSLAGDRVAMENFQQHAEHYIRLINEAQRQIAERREQSENQNRGQNNDANGGDNQRSQRGASQESRIVDPGETEQPEIAEQRPARNKVSAEDKQADQNDVVERGRMPGSDAGGLVETPEDGASKPKSSKPRRAKQPKRAKQEEALSVEEVRTTE